MNSTLPGVSDPLGETPGQIFQNCYKVVLRIQWGGPLVLKSFMIFTFEISRHRLSHEPKGRDSLNEMLTVPTWEVTWESTLREMLSIWT